MARKEITVKRSYLITDHGTFPLDELTPEQKEEACKAMRARVLNMMREYYRRNMPGCRTPRSSSRQLRNSENSRKGNAIWRRSSRCPTRRWRTI